MSPRRGDPPPPLDTEALAAVAEELYSLAPAEFTAARDARVKEARSRGERALATAVGGLRRPTAAAWLANLLVREERGQVEELLALGDALREAQAGLEGAALRQLSAQRHRVVAALAAEARRLAAQHGQPTGADAAEQLEQTLEAAMSDPAAAEALRSGRLTSGLAYAGLGELSGSAARGSEPTAGQVPRVGDGGRGRDERQRAEAQRAERERAEAERAERAERERAEAERAEARRALAAAEAGMVDAERQVGEQDEAVRSAARRREAADEQQADLQRRLADLRERLRLAEEEAAAAQAEERARAARREAALRGAEVARRRVEQARRRLERTADQRGPSST